SNFLQTKTESHSSHKFSFVMSYKTPDSAFVDATHEFMARTQPGLKVGSGVTVGGDTGLKSDQFRALIDVHSDSTETWALSIGTTEGTKLDGAPQEGTATNVATLTHGD